jgi:hypothetical protein
MRALFLVQSTVRFAILGAAAEVSMSAEGNLWYVKTADGDVQRMTLDQIDEAFNAGRIDVDTMCLPDGAIRWARLGELAGLDAPAPAAAPAPTRAPAPAYAQSPVPNSLRPVSMDLGDDDGLDAPFARKSGKGRVVGLLAVTAVLGTAGFLAMRTAPPSVAPQAPAPLPALAPPPSTASPPAASASDPYAPPTPTTSADPASRLTAEQKAKLLAADKAREEKAKARHKSRWHPSPRYKSQGFTTGGSKYDPLNAGL